MKPVEETSSMEELLKNHGELYTFAHFCVDRERLLRRFWETYNFVTAAEINEALRTCAIPETVLVDDWISFACFADCFTDEEAT